MAKGIKRAASHLYTGGVIAYPTEGVFGLGCIADNFAAIWRLLAIKRRDPDKGLILIASRAEQLTDWINLNGEVLPDANASSPTTWIVAPGRNAHRLVCGTHDGLAVRLTTNPVAAAICDAVAAPIVSTSANISGRPVARNSYLLRRHFTGLVDYVVPGRCGPASGPSIIRVFSTGQVVRPAAH